MTITPPEHRSFSSEALSRKVSGRSGAMLIGVADIDGLGGAEDVQAALEAITGIIGSGSDHDHGDLYVTTADLDALLDEKADLDHTHPAATSSAAGFMTGAQFQKLAGIETGATADMTAAEIFAALATYRGAASGLASLDSSGLVPEAQIPAVAITDTFEVASQSAMLALSAQRGDVAVRSDLNKSFILRATPASTLSNWSELRTPTDAVLSVFGRTGAVGAVAGDYSAAQITNIPAGNIAAATVQAALNELDSEKQAISARNQVSGYAGLNASGFVDPAQLGSGTRDSTTVLYGDGTFKTAPAGGGGGGSMTDQQILDAIKRVDSSGSGIDADLLDGLSAADFLLASSRAAANGVAPLGADSLIPEAYIPAVAITDTFEVSSQAAMLTLTAQRGDVAIRSDVNKSFVLRATPASTLANWSELRTPTDAVLSVFGRTGAIGAVAGDYSAAQITNTPAGSISAATVQAALNELDVEKQPLLTLQESGAALTKRPVIDFADGLIAQDDSTNGKTIINAPASGPMATRTRKSCYICGGTNALITGLTQGNVRHVIRLPAKTNRWRLRIMNYNIRDEGAGGDVALTSVQTGLHAPAADGSWTGNMQAAFQIQGAQAIVGGAEYVTDWVTDVGQQFDAYVDRVISLGFTCASGAQIATSPNKSFRSASTSNAAALAPGHTLQGDTPLSVVVEYEFQGEMEVGLYMGDSITDGAVTNRGVASNYANQFAMVHESLAVVHAAGGSQAQDWVVDGRKWSRIPLSEMSIDYAVVSLGTNDLGGGNRTPAQLKADLLSIVQRLKGFGIKRIFFGRIMPRRDPGDASGWTTTKEGYRNDVNDWMGTFPGDTYGAIFFDHAVRSTTDETLLASEFQTDVLHPDTTGHSRLAAELAHVLKGAGKLTGPQGIQGTIGPGGGAQYEVRRYSASSFTNDTFAKSSGFDTAVRPNPQIVIPALGTPPAGYAWRIDVEGVMRTSLSVTGSVGFCVNFNGAVSNALIGQAHAAGGAQTGIALGAQGLIPPSTSAQITIDFTAWASAAGNLTIYQTNRPKATCYLVAA